MAVVYGVAASPYVRKVMLAHGAKGVPYEMKITMPRSDDAEFRAASPLGKVPAYRTDDGFSFSDSAVIIAYLERCDHSVSLYPKDNNQFAHALWLDKYASTVLMEATSALYYQLIVGPNFFDHKTDAVRVTELTTQLIPQGLDYIESQMSDGWLVGEHLSVADISVATNLFNLMHTKFDLDISRWPKTVAYFERLKALDFIKAQIDTELKLFAQAG